jgi:integrase
VGDIDFLRRQLHVRRQVQRTSKETGVELRPPKYGSERVVYLADELVQILARQRRGMRAMAFQGPGR